MAVQSQGVKQKRFKMLYWWLLFNVQMMGDYVIVS